MIFPSRRFTLASPLFPDQAEAALRAEIKPKRNWRDTMRDAMSVRGDRGGAYTGTVADGRFRLIRDINYRNSFLPVVDGFIEGGAGPASRIHVTMRMHASVRVFMAVWLGFVAVGGGTAVAAVFHPESLHGQAPPLPALVIPAGMLIFGLALPHIGFHGEARKATDFLKQTLKAEVEAVPDGRRAI